MVSFAGLIVHNILVKKVRLAVTALAVAIGVLAVVSLGVVTQSLQSTDLALLQTGRADFAVAQKGVTDLLSSSIDSVTMASVARVRGVADLTGVLIGTTRLDAANPQFLEIGIRPADLAAFGVTVVAGRPFTASATKEVLLGYIAARDLGVKVGQSIRLDQLAYRVVGLYSTGQSLGDAGAMLPLSWFQTHQRQPSQYTLLFVRVSPGVSIPDLQTRINQAFPELTTIRTLTQFGRADRSLALILAANRGATLLATLIGAVVVMSAMSMTFVERIREFGVLAAIGWTPRRIASMILGEAGLIGLLGIAAGLALSVAAVAVVGHLPVLEGVLHPEYTAGIFARALYTALAMVFLGALVPAVRASTAAPLESLRHE
jgi:putative ABC transport system permease protein